MKINKGRVVSIIYFLFDTMLQVSWIFYIPSFFALDLSDICYRYGLMNSYFIQIMGIGIFGENRVSLNLIFIAFILLVFLLIAFFVLLFLKKKYAFLIPLFLTTVNIIFHVIFMNQLVTQYWGLVYKVIGCLIYTSSFFSLIKNK